jgi:anti-sigma-K factor RskA
MKCYKNPDVFEPLAMAYVLGTLQGKARLRFEGLMAQHLYLRATVQAYEQQLNGLVELVPERAVPAHVWKNIEQQLPLQAPKASWWAKLQPTFYWALPSLAAVLAAVLTAYFLQKPTQPQAYIATLKSPQQKQVVLAMAKHDEMKISFEMLDKDLAKQQGVVPTLWCISKQKDEPPMRMGTLGTSKQEIALNTKMWKGLAGASEFAISLEPSNANSQAQPQGEIILSGTLHPIGH